ncbi:MAG: AbrB/MazE/SpoVT family DNA-binding domain-containing protein [Desulfobacterales bacterium]|nr:AbrB/MazE/SpoVT family DNA-binding domain-containing protein [Desulfobacterales bacterium]
MLVAIDKRGSINLPVAVRKELDLKTGSYLEMDIEDGGAIVLHPVSIYRGVRLSEKGIQKLRDARESGPGSLPDWMIEDMKNADVDSK